MFSLAPQKKRPARKPPAQPAWHWLPKATMYVPRWRASGLRLPPLEKNHYRSKLYGLMSLKEIASGAGLKVLDFSVCKDPDAFSIRAFKHPSEGRLIIRTDIDRQSHTHSMEEWASMPRLNLYLQAKDPAESEKKVREWMAGVLRSHQGVLFIVHKVRPLRDYERSVQLNADLQNGQIIISTTKAGTDKFRDEPTAQTELVVDESERIRRPLGSVVFLPESLQRETLFSLEKLMRYARKTSHNVFEASYVTYKEAPSEPEFYDLVFGKKM